MKMTKKLLFVAACSALAFVFSSCDLADFSMTDIFQKKFGADVFSYSDNDKEDGLGKWTITGENTSTTEYMRGMQFLQTKHSDMAASVSIEGADGGVVAVAFNVSQNTDKELDNYKTYNFCLAGIRYYQGAASYYVSYYANISAENMVDYNFGAYTTDGDKKTALTKTAVDPDCYTPYEIVFQDITTIKDGLIDSETDTLNAVIDVDEITDDDAAASTYGAGTYMVSIYKADAYDSKKMKFVDDKEDYLMASAAPADATALGKTKAAQAKVGVYANVYPAKSETEATTLNAVVEIADLTNALIAE